MTEQEAIDYVTLQAQTAAFPTIETEDVQKIVQRHMRAKVWQSDTAYKIGDRIQPTSPNGHFYECIAAGESDSVEPEWSLVINSRLSEFGSDLVWQECETDFDGNLYNLRNAIHECWTLKASMSANQFDTSIDNQSWKRSQIHEHCLQMARSFMPFD